MGRKRKPIDVGVIPRIITLTVPVLMDDMTLFTKFVYGSEFRSNNFVSYEENRPDLHKQGFIGAVFEMQPENEGKFFHILSAYYDKHNITFKKPT